MAYAFNPVLGRQKQADQDQTALQTEHQASKAYTVRTSFWTGVRVGGVGGGRGGSNKQTPPSSSPNKKDDSVV